MFTWTGCKRTFCMLIWLNIPTSITTCWYYLNIITIMTICISAIWCTFSSILYCSTWTSFTWSTTLVCWWISIWCWVPCSIITCWCFWCCTTLIIWCTCLSVCLSWTSSWCWTSITILICWWICSWSSTPCTIITCWCYLCWTTSIIWCTCSSMLYCSTWTSFTWSIILCTSRIISWSFIPTSIITCWYYFFRTIFWTGYWSFWIWFTC